MLSTKFMPAVGVIVPLFLLFRNLQRLDTLPGLILMYTTTNLPLVVLPVLVFGWVAQRQLVRGLSFGSVK